MNPNRQYWNQQQKALQQALRHAEDYSQAIQLFLEQHAMVHSAQMALSIYGWSFEDEALQGLSETSIQHVPTGSEHSIAWVLWHIARIEDVTMNLLVAGSDQVLYQGSWLDQLHISNISTGNDLPVESVAAVSAAIDVTALRAYRIAVGQRTRQIVQQITSAELKQKVQPERLRQVVAQGALSETSSDILAYWGGLTVAGLLLMPATRHNFVHLNEVLKIKRYHLRSPFPSGTAASPPGYARSSTKARPKE